MNIKPQLLLLYIALIASNPASAQSNLVAGQGDSKPGTAQATVNFVINISPKLELSVANKKLSIKSNSGNLLLVDAQGHSRPVSTQNGITDAKTQRLSGLYTIAIP